MWNFFQVIQGNGYHMFPSCFGLKEPLRTLYGNEFCLSLMKTLLSTEGSRNQRRGISIRLVVLPLIQIDDSFLGSKWNLWFCLEISSVSLLGKKSQLWEIWLFNMFSWESSNLLLYHILVWKERQFSVWAKDKTQLVYFL